MKSKLLSSFLLALVGLVGNVTATAQTPEPDGLWTFENTADLLAASKGSLLMTPCAIGDYSISASTVDEAGIKAADGPTAGSAAILVPATSALKVDRGEGAPATTSFSLMIDLKVPDAYAYDGLLQSNLANSNDGDLFISKCQIGAGAMGGYFGCIWNDMWYRVVFTNSEGSLKVYVNGEKVLQYATTETRWELDPTFYLLADEDGEKVDTYVSEIAFWETPLTDAEVSEMGSIDLLPWITGRRGSRLRPAISSSATAPGLLAIRRASPRLCPLLRPTTPSTGATSTFIGAPSTRSPTASSGLPRRWATNGLSSIRRNKCTWAT